MSTRSFQRGFTLIELVLVLVILSTLATLALETVEPKVDQTRFETTQKTIQDVQQAFAEVRRTAGDRAVVNGFVADMGRMPRARDVGGQLTVSELWLQGSLPPYSSVPAETMNLAATEDSDGDTVRADPNIRLAFGWRGPYLQLTPGATELRDGWGHALISSHLRSQTDDPINSPGIAIYGVRSFGRSDTEDAATPNDPYEMDLPARGQLVDATNYYGSISGTVYLNGKTASTDQVVVQVFSPDPTSEGKIAVECASKEASSGASSCEGGRSPEIEISGSGLADVSDSSQFSAFTFRFDDGCGDDRRFPVGTRMMRAYYDDSSSSTSSAQSVPVTVTLLPGHNTINLTINISSQ